MQGEQEAIRMLKLNDCHRLNTKGSTAETENRDMTSALGLWGPSISPADCAVSTHDLYLLMAVGGHCPLEFSPTDPLNGAAGQARAKNSSLESPYVTTGVMARGADYSVVMRNSFLRYLSTNSEAALRIWLAQFPEEPTIWRSLMNWGHKDRVGPLLEVLIPGNSRSLSLALGGSEVLAISEGKLFGAPLSVSCPEQSAFASLPLREIEPAPVEASRISATDFTRHCRRSEDLGIPLATQPNASYCMKGESACGLFPSVGSLTQFINAGEFVVDVACGTASTCVVTRSGRVFTSGAAYFGVNGSGMLVSTQAFKELEFFQGILAPDLLEAKRRIEEEQLQQLEKLRKALEGEGTEGPHTIVKPFETRQDVSKEINCASTAADSHSPCSSMSNVLRFPQVMCGTYHCGLLTPEGALWLWGRNDRLQLSRNKPVMASGRESNYPLSAEFFTRACVPLASCALGPWHSLALARNGAVYEWGGMNAESPHRVDLHWRYQESISKGPVRKVVAGGFSSTTAFSAALTESGEVFLWGPGALKMPLSLKATQGQIPELLQPPPYTGEPRNQQNGEKCEVVDIFAGQQGCLFVTTDSSELLRARNS
ncbi:hypothetical protein, conserved [Eimeria praecox]|uniref:Uncharacterized protein n=1 Tax=Eimeria praecox TaxID=51316 RepID=U6H1C9_9EIME|nr:hypothetical protein, conserved [Eimeria praecox]